jgi:AraC-like DNA-binding protein
MKGRLHKGQPDVKSLGSSDEFRPRLHTKRGFDLRGFGVPQVPAIFQSAIRQKGASSPWHVHRGCIEFVYCATGTCEYESDGQRFCLKPGMMFVSRPHEPHRHIDNPTKSYATFSMLFKPSANSASRWFADRFSKLPRLFVCSRSVSVRFGKIIALAERGGASEGDCIRMKTYIHSLWLDILDSAATSVRQKVPESFDAIAERMRKRPERDYPLDGLVAESGMSKSSFIALFKTAHGLTPHAFLLQCRIEAAKRLLEDGFSVKDAADRLGFPSAQHFSRTFRNFVGVTPAKWRQRGKSA